MYLFQFSNRLVTYYFEQEAKKNVLNIFTITLVKEQIRMY